MSYGMFDDIKVGDEVAHLSNYGWESRHPQLTKVKRITPKRFEIECASGQFRKSDGVKVGEDTWSYSRCTNIDDEVLRRVEIGKLENRHRRAVAYINEFSGKVTLLRNQDLSTVERIAEFLKGEMEGFK